MKTYSIQKTATRVAILKVRKLLFLYLCFIILRICSYSLFETPDRLPKAFAQRRQFAGTEENKGDNQYNYHFRHTHTKHFLPPVNAYYRILLQVQYLFNCSILTSIYQMYASST